MAEPLDPAVERSAPEAPGADGPAYEPPAVLWEQEFVALASVSAPPCDPNSDPFCTG